MSINIYTSIICILAFPCLPALAQTGKLTQTGDRNYSLTVDIPYGDLKEKMQQHIESYGSQVMQDIKAAYREQCGEGFGYDDNNSPLNIDLNEYVNCNYDFVKFINGSTQKILEGRITPKQIGTIRHDGVKVTLKTAFDFQVQIQPLNPNYKSNQLDYKKVMTLPRKKPFFKNIEVRYKPNVNVGIVDFCMYMPGAKIDGRVEKIKARAVKKVAGVINAKADVDIYMNIGKMQFQSSSICSSAVISFLGTDNRGNPLFDYKLYSQPVEFENLKYHGAKVTKTVVRGANLISKIGLSIAKLFGVKVNAIAKNALNEQIQKQLNLPISNFTKKFDNGSLWKDVYDQLSLPIQITFTRNMGKAVSKSLKQSVSTEKIDIEKLYDRVCQLAAGAYNGPQSNQTYYDVCTRGLKKTEVSFFTKVPQFANRGCYKHYFHAVGSSKYIVKNGTKPMNPWWETKCAHRSTVDITVANNYQDAVSCVVEHQNLGNSFSEIAEICEDQINAAVLLSI